MPKSIDEMSSFLRLILPPMTLPTIAQRITNPKNKIEPISYSIQKGSFPVIVAKISNLKIISKKNQARVPEFRRMAAKNFLLEIRRSLVKNPRFKQSPQTYYINDSPISLLRREKVYE